MTFAGNIAPPDDRWLPSDAAFQMYLDGISPETFSSWEWRVYQHARLRITERK